MYNVHSSKKGRLLFRYVWSTYVPKRTICSFVLRKCNCLAPDNCLERSLGHLNPNGMTNQYGKNLAILILLLYQTSTYVPMFCCFHITIKINMARFLPY
jgi:hypothetical protein